MRRYELVILACVLGSIALGCGDGEASSSSTLATTSGGAGGAVSGSGGAGGTSSGGGAPIAMGCDASAPATTTISCVARFTPGPGAGFGEDRFPDVVYGPPHGGGDHGGSTDVLSLGTDGVVVVGFGGNAIVDGDGADFIVFENAFLSGGKPFKELAEISVSDDGEAWTPFPCAAAALPYDGCAGWHPVYSNPDNNLAPTDPAAAGGDVFDLATIGVAKARFIRITDLHNTTGMDGTTGFDLDAVAIVHAAEP